MKKTTTTLSALVAVILPASANFQKLVDTYEGDVSVSMLESNTTAGKIVRSPGNLANMNDGLAPMLAEGTQEFGIAGSLNFAEDVAYNLNLTYGVFIKDGWEFGFGVGVQGVESDYTFSLGLFTEYNFVLNPTSKWVPFVGFSMNWAKLDSDAFDTDSIALGLQLGVKYFVRENIAISTSIGADFAFDDVFPGGDDFQEQINIGTRFYF